MSFAASVRPRPYVRPSVAAIFAFAAFLKLARAQTYPINLTHSLTSLLPSSFLPSFLPSREARKAAGESYLRRNRRKEERRKAGPYFYVKLSEHFLPLSGSNGESIALLWSIKRIGLR